MRMYGFRPAVAPNLRPPQAPPDMRLAFSPPSQRRRLDDAMVAVFERALGANNFDGAADVLEVLEQWHERRAARYGRERRIDDRHLVLMRAELERLTALRRM
jgi:hypothetical protein